MEPAPKHETTQRAPLEVGKRSRFDLGPVGATAIVAGVVAIAITIALGLVIPNIVEQHLLRSTANSIQTTVNEIASSTRPGHSLTEENASAFQDEVEHLLLGREIVRVKIWNAMGTIIFSDEERLIGRNYKMSHDIIAAFNGELIWEEPDLSRPENEYERGLGELREYYVPVDSGTQGVEVVFEVYELADALVETIANIRVAVWIALGSGTTILLVALTAAAVTNALAEGKRRARSERLISQLLEIQEDERTRIVGALHDDIGQPLYRILFGLQASRRMVDQGSEVDRELTRLDVLVREVDTAL